MPSIVISVRLQSTSAVTQGVVQLTGKVSSDIDRDLAGELAKGIEGVVDVNNDLQVVARTGDTAATAVGSGDRSFGAWIDDATTTASVKSKLLGNPNTEGLQIDVDTRGDVVTLSGEVASAEEKALAEELTRNTGDVKMSTRAPRSTPSRFPPSCPPWFRRRRPGEQWTVVGPPITHGSAEAVDDHRMRAHRKELAHVERLHDFALFVGEVVPLHGDVGLLVPRGVFLCAQVVEKALLHLVRLMQPLLPRPGGPTQCAGTAGAT